VSDFSESDLPPFSPFAAKARNINQLVQMNIYKLQKYAQGLHNYHQGEKNTEKMPILLSWIFFHTLKL